MWPILFVLYYRLVIQEEKGSGRKVWVRIQAIYRENINVSTNNFCMINAKWRADSDKVIIEKFFS